MENLAKEEQEFRELVASLGGVGVAVADALSVTPSLVSHRLNSEMHKDWWEDFKRTKAAKDKILKDAEDRKFREVVVRYSGDTARIANALSVRVSTVYTRLNSEAHKEWWDGIKDQLSARPKRGRRPRAREVLAHVEDSKTTTVVERTDAATSDVAVATPRTEKRDWVEQLRATAPQAEVETETITSNDTAALLRVFVQIQKEGCLGDAFPEATEQAWFASVCSTEAPCGLCRMKKTRDQALAKIEMMKHLFEKLDG